tara:strand:+ start:169 stop:354 length:186 start_codon:yes stop_codon:yes gene_type:complete
MAVPGSMDFDVDEMMKNRFYMNLHLKQIGIVKWKLCIIKWLIIIVAKITGYSVQIEELKQE